MKIKLFQVACGSLTLLASCSSTDISPARAHYESGDYELAADTISEIHPYNEAEGYHDSNRAEDNIWLLLEKGKMLADAGLWDESNIAFYEADLIFTSLEDEATVSLGGIRSGAAALLIDDRQSDYVGNSYDKILLPAYVCLNHLMLGEFEYAANAARQLARHEAQAASYRETQAARIAEMEGDVAATNEDGTPKHEGVQQSEGQGSYLAALAAFELKYQQRDEGKSNAFASNFPESLTGEVDGIKAAAGAMAAWQGDGYQIPFAQLVGALSLDANGDRGEAGSMYASLESVVGAPLGQSRTAYVVFETGNVPKREDRSVGFVYFYTAKVKVKDENGNIVEKEVLVPSFVKLPFVGLTEPSGVTASLEVASGAGSVQTRALGSLAGVVAKEFEDALPEIIARIVLRALIQEAAQIIANQEVGGLMVFAGGILKSLVEPDLRSWESLGAQHQVAAIAVPEDGRLTLTLAGGAEEQGDGSGVSSVSLDIEVPVGPPVLVYVRSTNLGNFIAHSCALGKVEANNP